MAKKMLGDRTWLTSWVDHPALNQTNMQTAVQLMWGTNTIASGITAASGVPNPDGPTPPTITVGTQAQYVATQLGNLMIMDPYILSIALKSNNVALAGGLEHATKFLIKSYTTKARITNTETAPLEFIEYRVRARRQQQAIGGKVDQYLTNGFQDADQDVIGDALINANTYGATPFDLPRFIKENKIVKVKKFVLSPGQFKDFAYKTRGPRNIAYNDLFTGSTSASIGNLVSARKGDSWSVFCMRPTITGRAANSAPPTSVANGAFGVTPVSCAITYQVRLHYCQLYDSANRITSALTSIPGIINGAVPAPVYAQTALAQTAGGVGAGPEAQDLLD